MISSLSWIPRGSAKLKPELAEIDKDDTHGIDSSSEEGDQVGAVSMHDDELVTWVATSIQEHVFLFAD